MDICRLYSTCNFSVGLRLALKMSKYSNGYDNKTPDLRKGFKVYSNLGEGCVRCKLQPKELVMVHGASGGVGVAAVQIAQAHGAVVAASAGSEEGLGLLKSLGVNIVVDHRESGHLQKALAEAKQAGFGVIFENRADINLGIDLAALGVGGRIVVVGSRGPVEVDPRNFIRTEGIVLGVHLQKTSVEEFAEFSSALVAGMEEGWLNPVVGREYSMSEIQQAHLDLIKPHGAYGKMVLKII